MAARNFGFRKTIDGRTVCADIVLDGDEVNQLILSLTNHEVLYEFALGDGSAKYKKSAEAREVWRRMPLYVEAFSDTVLSMGGDGSDDGGAMLTGGQIGALRSALSTVVSQNETPIRVDEEAGGDDPSETWCDYT